MTSFQSYRWAGTAFAVGVVCAAFAVAQPPTPLDVAKQRQQLAEQKAESVVLTAIQDADRVARTNPTKAAQLLRAAKQDVNFAVGVSDVTRTKLTKLLDTKIALVEGRPVPADPKPGVV